jgi:hypothetical protein
MMDEALEPLLRAVSTQAGEEKMTEKDILCLFHSARDILGLVLNTRDLCFRVSEGVGWLDQHSCRSRLILDSPETEKGLELRLVSVGRDRYLLVCVI